SSRESGPPSRFFIITSTARIECGEYSAPRAACSQPDHFEGRARRTRHPAQHPALGTPHRTRHHAPGTRHSYNLFVTQASQLSPELGRSLLQVARALLVAARNWSLYPPEHPTVAVSVKRLGEAVHESSLGAIFSIGITPDTLMIEGAAADASQAGIAEAAALLHDRHLLTLTFVGDVPEEALHAFLRILALEPAERRARGGPVKIWLAESGHPSISMEQIDYQHLLAREEGDVPEPARRDDLWQSIVMSI